MPPESELLKHAEQIQQHDAFINSIHAQNNSELSREGFNAVEKHYSLSREQLIQQIGKCPVAGIIAIELGEDKAVQLAEKYLEPDSEPTMEEILAAEEEAAKKSTIKNEHQQTGQYNYGEKKLPLKDAMPAGPESVSNTPSEQAMPAKVTPDTSAFENDVNPGFLEEAVARLDTSRALPDNTDSEKEMPGPSFLLNHNELAHMEPNSNKPRETSTSTKEFSEKFETILPARNNQMSEEATATSSTEITEQSFLPPASSELPVVDTITNFDPNAPGTLLDNMEEESQLQFNPVNTRDLSELFEPVVKPEPSTIDTAEDPIIEETIAESAQFIDGLKLNLDKPYTVMEISSITQELSDLFAAEHQTEKHSEQSAILPAIVLDQESAPGNEEYKEASILDPFIDGLRTEAANNMIDNGTKLEIKEASERIKQYIEEVRAEGTEPELTEQVVGDLLTILRHLGCEDPKKTLTVFANQYKLNEFVDMLSVDLQKLVDLIDYQQHLLLALSLAKQRSKRHSNIAAILMRLLFSPDKQVAALAA